MELDKIFRANRYQKIFLIEQIPLKKLRIYTKVLYIFWVNRFWNFELIKEIFNEFVWNKKIEIVFNLRFLDLLKILNFPLYKQTI